MPTMQQPIASGTTPGSSTARAMPSALHTPAATIAQRSPQRIVITEAGMLFSSDPSPISVTTKAAIGTEAPRSRASSGTIGRIAPSPTPNSREGPKAGRAMRRQEKESSEAYRSAEEGVSVMDGTAASEAGARGTDDKRSGPRHSRHRWNGAAHSAAAAPNGCVQYTHIDIPAGVNNSLKP